MSNQFLPVAYAFTNVGVFNSNDGINFITGLDANDNILTVTADNLGDRIIIYPDHIFIGNNTINATVNSTIYTGTAANAANVVLTTPGGANTQVQFNDSGAFGGNVNFTFVKTTGVMAAPVMFAGNSSQNTHQNSTGFYINGVLVGGSITGSYVQNTDSRVMSGNLNFTGANNYFSSGLFAGANVVINTTTMFVGNSTQNTIQNSTGFFVNGSIITSGGGSGTSYGFYAVKSANQALSNNTTTKLTFATEVYDNGGYYDAANSRWTPPAGLVQINASQYFLVTGGNIAQGTIRVYKNGVEFHSDFDISAVPSQLVQVSFVDYANGTDYYEVYGDIVASASGHSAQSVSNYTFFTGSTLGSATTPATAYGFIANKNGTNQTSLANTTWTKMTATNEVVDIGGYYDAANSRWTPPAGLVKLKARAYMQIPTGYAGAIYVNIYKNGTSFKFSGVPNLSAGTNINYHDIAVDTEDYANGTDYYEAWVYVQYNTGGVNGYVDGRIDGTWFEGHTITTGVATFTTQSADDNIVVNPAMEIAQERTTTSTSGEYPVDQWAYHKTGSMVCTAAQVADGPPGFVNSLKVTVGTANSSLAAGEYVVLQQPIEGTRIARLGFGASTAQGFTLGFWCKTFRTGTYSGSYRNAAGTRAFPFTWTQNVSNTWEWKTVTVTADTSGTWVTSTAQGATLTFSVACGSTYLGTGGIWSASNYLGATGTINAVQSTSDTFQITGVVMFPGSVSLNSLTVQNLMRHQAQELSLCQRYWESTYANVVPGTVTGTGMDGVIDQGASATTIGVHLKFSTRKRAAPTVTTYSYNTGTANRVYQASNGADLTPTVDLISDRGMRVYVATATLGLYFHWVANARI